MSKPSRSKAEAKACANSGVVWLLAPDYDDWGYDANERMVNDFCREAYEQGLTEHLNTADKLFPKAFLI